MKRLIFYCITVLIILILAALAFPNYVKVEPRDRYSISHHAKTNLYSIQSALERYCDDRGEPINGKAELGCVYPADISILIGDYFNELPINPCTKENMEFISLGSEPQSGEFTYVPIYKDGTVKYYFLFVYGDEIYKYDSEEWDGFGFKRVLLMLTARNAILPMEDYFLKGASVPTLLDKWKKPATRPESTDNGE